MHPAATEFMILLAQNGLNIATGMAMNHVKVQAQKKIIDSYSENVSKQQKILSQHDHGGHSGGGKFNPIIPNDVGLISTEDEHKNDHEHEPQRLESTEPPFIDVPNTGDLTQMHAEKWNEYWKELYDLPDNASTGNAVKAMKKIQADIENYPCPSCKENAKMHLKEMKEENDQFTRVSTKKDAVMKLCRFKNKINAMKDEEIFPCEALIQ